MAFLENTDYYNNWDDMSANDQYLSSLDKYMYNTSNTEWNNASGDVSKTIIGTMDPSVPLDYGGKKVGGRCKVKIRTGYSKFTCRGRYDQSGRCIPCDNAQVPRITNDGPVRSGGRGRRPRGGFLRGGFNNASGCGYSNASGCGYSNAAGRGRVRGRSADKPLKDILTIPLCCLWNKKCCKDIKGPFRQINNTLYPTR